MNLEQREHQICEIIRRVCERNNVGVEFRPILGEGGAPTTLDTILDLGRARKKDDNIRIISLIAAGAAHIGICFLAPPEVARIASLGTCAAVAFAAYRVLLAKRTPLVDRYFLDQEIAFMLAMHGCIVMQSWNRMQIHTREE